MWKCRGGYLNLFFDRSRLLGDFASASIQTTDTPADADQLSARPKLIVEHTNINPNKAAHIGHLRNSVLGDTFVRVLRAAGERVEVQNYIDNTGVQVADVVVGFMHVEASRSKTSARSTHDFRGAPFDYTAGIVRTRRTILPKRRRRR